jgi:hypothetical protein
MKLFGKGMTVTQGASHKRAPGMRPASIRATTDRIGTDPIKFFKAPQQVGRLFLHQPPAGAT